jgi:hypothetical protein
MNGFTFAEVLEMLGDERFVSPRQVLPGALKRKVWIAEWHIPGCLSESSAICCTKAEAIEQALSFASDADGCPPRGMRADLLKFGSSSKLAANAYVGMATTTISRATLADCL